MSIVENIQEAERVTLSKLGVLIECLGADLDPKTAQELREEAERLFDMVNHEKLLHDADILISLRLLIVPIINEKGDDWTVELVKKLAQALPLRSVTALSLRIMEFVAMVKRFNLQLAPTPMELQDHIARRMGKLTKTVHQRPRTIIFRNASAHSGTETWIEHCPKCGEEKRCDKNTRRFVCKKCFFKSSYPFPTAP